jgi:hypothetical protein
MPTFAETPLTAQVGPTIAATSRRRSSAARSVLEDVGHVQVA